MNSARKRNQPKTVSDGPQLALLFRLHGARLPGSTRHKRWSAELLPLLVPPPPPPSTVVSNAPLSFGFGNRIFKKPEWAVEWDARSAAWQAECAAWEAEMDAARGVAGNKIEK
ncbi:hypothetical protein EJB05_48325, partial [Eragrostis curvula]